MARNIKVYAPSGYTDPTVVLVDDSDAIVQTIALTEGVNGKGIYKGIVSAPAGTYDALVFENSGADHRGSFSYVRVLGVDPEVVQVGDAHGVPDGIKLGNNHRNWSAMTRSGAAWPSRGRHSPC